MTDKPAPQSDGTAADATDVPVTDADTQAADHAPGGRSVVEDVASASDIGAGAEGVAAAEARATATDDTANGDTTDGDTADGGADGHAEDGETDGGTEDAAPDYDQLAADDPRSPGELLRDLEAVGTERDEYLDALQRSRAEFDNFRKRSARETAGARTAGVGDLAQQLLDVLDDLDRTADVAEQSEDSGLAGGIQAIHRKLVDVLRSVGVERIDATGVPFDATRHEAVQQVPAEEPVDQPEVAQVLRPGYLHKDRVLRAAMVSVRQ